MITNETVLYQLQHLRQLVFEGPNKKVHVLLLVEPS